jgi:two-component system sensor histidine kinase ChvG
VQVFENLLDNALSFSPVGSAVRIEVAREGSEVVAAVRDRGPGIPPEHGERVFDRFFTYRPGPGDGDGRGRHSGLGLAIVRAVVEGYGGSVRVARTGPGGAVLEVRLPLHPS